MSANKLITYGVVAIGVWFFFFRKENATHGESVSGGTETPPAQTGVMIDEFLPFEESGLR